MEPPLPLPLRQLPFKLWPPVGDVRPPPRLTRPPAASDARVAAKDVPRPIRFRVEGAEADLANCVIGLWGFQMQGKRRRHGPSKPLPRRAIDEDVCSCLPPETQNAKSDLVGFQTKAMQRAREDGFVSIGCVGPEELNDPHFVLAAIIRGGPDRDWALQSNVVNVPRKGNPLPAAAPTPTSGPPAPSTNPTPMSGPPAPFTNPTPTSGPPAPFTNPTPPSGSAVDPSDVFSLFGATPPEGGLEATTCRLLEAVVGVLKVQYPAELANEVAQAMCAQHAYDPAATVHAGACKDIKVSHTDYTCRTAEWNHPGANDAWLMQQFSHYDRMATGLCQPRRCMRRW